MSGTELRNVANRHNHVIAEGGGFKQCGQPPSPHEGVSNRHRLTRGHGGLKTCDRFMRGPVG